jgi:hypothetical protein
MERFAYFQRNGALKCDTLHRSQSRSKSICNSAAGIAMLLVVFVFPLASTAKAGPNAGGVIVLHRNEDIIYTSDVTNYCGMSDVPDCLNAETRADVDDIVVLHALAAFHPGSRLAGVCFGVQYDETRAAIVDWGMCGDFELHTQDWPSSDDGLCIVWFEAQTDPLVELCWFAAHSVDGSATLVSLIGHPNGGGHFADDDIPANLDEIAGYGTFGFYMDGSVPCGDDEPVGACCLQDGSCYVTTPIECAANDGEFLGIGTECVPGICAVPTVDESWGVVKQRFH